jgi:phosphate transport system substrate-binding protein
MIIYPANALQNPIPPHPSNRAPTMTVLSRRLGVYAGACALLAGLCAPASTLAEELKIGGTGTALGTMALLGQAYSKLHPDVRVTVLPSMGSGGGIKAVMAGAISLAVSWRVLSDDERKAGAQSIEYGRSPFVFATQSTSKVSAISQQELVDIYAGKTTQWPDGTRIRLVLRPKSDADSELIRSLSPAMREATAVAEDRKGITFSVTDQDAASDLEKMPGSLGASTLAQILSEKRQIKALTLNGVVPSAKALADGSYPLHKQLLLITGPKTPPQGHDFVAFVRSPAGREILAQNGHWVP